MGDDGGMNPPIIPMAAGGAGAGAGAGGGAEGAASAKGFDAEGGAYRGREGEGRRGT
jgi:hypothetical protein